MNVFSLLHSFVLIPCRFLAMSECCELGFLGVVTFNSIIVVPRNVADIMQKLSNPFVQFCCSHSMLFNLFKRKIHCTF